MLFLYFKSPEKPSPYHGELVEHLVRSARARETISRQDTDAELAGLASETEVDQLAAARSAESEVVHELLSDIREGVIDLPTVMSLLEEADRKTMIDLLSNGPEYADLGPQFRDFLETNPEYRADIAEEGETFKGKFAEIMEGLEKLPGAIWEGIKEAGRVTLDVVKALPLPVKLALGCLLLAGTIHGAITLLQAGVFDAAIPAFEAWRGMLDLPDLAVLDPDVVSAATNMLSSEPPL